jgi:hypothetical protein
MSKPIEVTILTAMQQWLKDNGYDLTVYTEIEKSMPDEFITLEKTGGGESNFIGETTIAIQSWADSLARAAEINEIAKDAARNLINDGRVIQADLQTDYPFTDTETKKYRYQAVFYLRNY